MPSTVPNTVRQGSTGPAVAVLQAQLNLKLPRSQPPLAVDTIFGPKTRARVLEFQRSAGLTADGVVGPLTWDALLRPSPVAPSAVIFIACGNTNPANQSRVQSFVQVAGGSRLGVTGSSAFFGSSAPASIPGLTRLGGSIHEAKARAVYLNSLDYNNIFLSPVTGAQNRPFTSVLPVSVFPVTFVQVINIGQSPSDSDLIHELAHAWQSQHHSDPKAFMGACLKCQGKAVALNGLIGSADPSVRGNKDFPVNFPFSAYAFKKGQAFGDYGGEQIAQQMQRNEAAIVSIVSGAAPGAVVAVNVTSLTKVTSEDTRDPNVHL